MRLTAYQELLADLQGHRTPRRTCDRYLQGGVWLDYVLHKSQMGLNEFAETYLHHADRGGLIYRWRDGVVIPRRLSVQRIAKRLEGKVKGSIEIYEVPLYPLLRNRRLSLRTVRKLLQVYAGQHELFPWSFPNDEELRAQRRFVPTMDRDDSASLVARGDIYGFTAIVGLVREAEAVGDADRHCLLCADMYRAFPAVTRLPWFRRHVELLRRCVTGIHHRYWRSWHAFDVDWGVIYRQIEAPVHETIRELRPRDPVTLRFVDLEDPVRFREPAVSKHPINGKRLTRPLRNSVLFSGHGGRST